MFEFNWSECVNKFPPSWSEQLARERGINPVTVEWLRKHAWIGACYVQKWRERCIGFPIYNQGGEVYRAHCRSPQRGEEGKWSWVYEPATDPLDRPIPALLFGSSLKAQRVFVFESQWDAIALIDRLNLGDEIDAGDVCMVTTRGGKIGNRLASLVWPKGVSVYAFPQSDSAGQGWLVDVLEALGGCYVIEIPSGLNAKDLNEWVLDGGASAYDLEAAIEHAELRKPEEHEQAAKEAREKAGENGKSDEDQLKEKYAFAERKRLDEMDKDLPSQLIQGVLYCGRRAMLTGSSKGRESFLLQQKAFCIGNGFPFIGLTTTKSKVLYVNFELLEPICRQRFEAMMKAAAPDNPSMENVRIISVAEHLDQLDPDFIAFIVSQAKEFGADLVIIDPIWRIFIGDQDENLTKDVREVLKPLTVFCRELGASLSFAQHQAKGRQDQKEAIDKFAGAGGFARDAATMLVMSNHQADNSAIVEIISNDFEPIEKFVIRFDFPFFTVDSSLDPEAIREPRKPGGRPGSTNRDTEAIFGFLQEADYNGGLTRSELAVKLDIRFGEEISSETVGRRLSELQKAGKVIENKHVKPYTYALSVEEANKLATRRSKHGRGVNGEHEPGTATQEEADTAEKEERETARGQITAKFLYDQMPNERRFTIQEFIDWAKENWGTGEKKARNILKDLIARGLVQISEEAREGTNALVRYRKAPKN